MCDDFMPQEYNPYYFYHFSLDMPKSVDELKDVWGNEKTIELISKLSFDGYILAGNSVANMIQGIPLQGDLDLWVEKSEKYIDVLREFYEYYDTYNLYPSMIEMFSSKGYPRINLLFSDMDPKELYCGFDLDYCRCSWSREDNIIHATFDCIDAIKTKLVKNVRYVLPERIYKAIKYGYCFTNSFWGRNIGLLLESSRDKIIASEDDNIRVIRHEDLDFSKFKKTDVTFKLTNITDVKNTLKELISQYKIFLTYENTKLPVFITFDKTQLSLLEIYVKKIIFSNPVTSGQYMSFSFKDEDGDHYHEITIDQNNSSHVMYIDSFDTDNARKIDKICRDVYTYPEEKIIKLNDNSYIVIEKLPDELMEYGKTYFYDMFKIHPEERHKIIMFEKEIETSRWQKSYLKTPDVDEKHIKHHSYMYSGYDCKSNRDSLPDVFMPYYKYMQSTDDKYNQVIVNWYQNNEDYIALHSDCTRGMLPDGKISIVTLYPSEESKSRILDIVPKAGVKSEYEKLSIYLQHGMIVTMCGKMQDEFKHGIQKEDEHRDARISISFRQMI